MNKFKQWILNRKFVIDSVEALKKDWIRQASIDAFTKAREDLQETNIYDVDIKAKELAKTMLNDMLSNVDLNSIVSVNPQGLIYIGGVRADAGQLSNLKAEAESISSFAIWKLLYETPKKLAEQAMFVNGETLADLQKGKSILFTLATQSKILDTFKSYQQIK